MTELMSEYSQEDVASLFTEKIYITSDGDRKYLFLEWHKMSNQRQNDLQTLNKNACITMPIVTKETSTTKK